MLDHRGRLLRAALGFAGLPRPSYDRSLWALRIWLDSWAGIGRVAVGMARQGYDLQLTRYDERGWRYDRGDRATGPKGQDRRRIGDPGGRHDPGRDSGVVGPLDDSPGKNTAKDRR